MLSPSGNVRSTTYLGICAPPCAVLAGARICGETRGGAAARESGGLPRFARAATHIRPRNRDTVLHTTHVTSTPRAPYPPEVETERLLLRQFRESDFEAYVHLMTTPELLHFLNRGEQRTREELWRNMTFHAGTWCIRGYGLWAMELKTTRELIGRAGMWYPEGWPEAEA